MSKKAPDPTPPKETSAAQTGSNVSTAISNAYMGNVSEYTPDGSTRVEQTGTKQVTDPYTGNTYDIPTFSRYTTLSDSQQAIKDQQDQAKLNLSKLAANQSGRVDGLLSKPFDVSGLPQAGNINDIRTANLQRVGDVQAPQLKTSFNTDFSADRQKVEDTLMARMQPKLDQDRKALESRLASQGIRIGSAAYNAAMDDYSRSTNDARMSAILAGGQEQSRLAGLDAQNAQFGNSALQQMYANKLQGISADNQSSLSEVNADAAKFSAANGARNQALQEAFAVRNQPINEITALMSGSQVSNPQFMGANMPQIPTTDNAGIIANYDRQRTANAQVDSNFLGSILGFGTNLLTAGVAGGGSVFGKMITSDRRAKTDIKKVGKTNDGQNIYQFRYKAGGPIQMGLMAQEVEKKKPEAVKEIGGIKAVNYGIALGGAHK